MANNAHAIEDVFATASLGGPEKAIGFVLWRVLHRYIREADRALADVNLTHLQFQTLALVAWLGRTGEPVTQAQLARAGDVAPMQISHMMKALENKGWIARPRSSSDVRAKNVEITDAGLAVLRQALPRMVQLQKNMFGEDGAPGGSLLTALLRLES
ncbi:MarR family transcriptional regulator [Mycobacterium sp. 852013-50091_SCH5140682]|uniref:MarR family winged helix-turn-helix transcriptional regulator n=1 Tax=Mycobacterium sp. 852013-50091_SCH5140682 TaxID=1834109 RepID=UPI0007EA0A31|nr:MarR family transcriptional regulator [Mycobacterium sp. 852013-50091_SCH5140682]OBC05400.1 MarR family transcriptional regulator [Mycobacterium sp. 852013-50091_SCH5140682]